MAVSRSPLSVLVISSTDKSVSFILQLLSSDRFYPVKTAKSGNEARRELISSSYDIVVINTPLSDEFGNDLALTVNESSSSDIILIVKNELLDQTVYSVEEYGILTVSKPLSKQLFLQALNLCSAMQFKQRRHEKEKEKLKTKIEEIRLVARAKCILMEHLRMSESNAHRYIEKQAMDMRVTRREIAENIIKTYIN